MRATIALIATLVAFVLACTGEVAPAPAPTLEPAAPSEPTPEPTPDADPVLGSAGGEASADPVRALCGSEPVLFGCPRSNGKALAVCGGPGRLQYRFGPPASPELVFPADPAQGPALMTLTEVAYARSTGHVLKFQNGDVRFEVTSLIGGGGGPDAESNNFVGVYLFQGEKMLDSVPCQGDSVGDLEAVKAVVPVQGE